MLRRSIPRHTIGRRDDGPARTSEQHPPRHRACCEFGAVETAPVRGASTAVRAEPAPRARRARPSRRLRAQRGGISSSSPSRCPWRRSAVLCDGRRAGNAERRGQRSAHIDQASRSKRELPLAPSRGSTIARSRVAAGLGVLVTLYRNDVFFDLSAGLHQRDSGYHSLEEALGSRPGFGTPRSLDAVLHAVPSAAPPVTAPDPAAPVTAAAAPTAAPVAAPIAKADDTDTRVAGTARTTQKPKPSASPGVRHASFTPKHAAPAPAAKAEHAAAEEPGAHLRLRR